MDSDLRFEAAGGASVGLGGEIRGVAGDRCVGSTFVDKREWIEEKELRLAGWSASAIVGHSAASEGLLCGSKDVCSVVCSSSTASSSSADVSFAAGESDKVKPL